MTNNVDLDQKPADQDLHCLVLVHSQYIWLLISSKIYTVKPTQKEDQKLVFKTDFRLMQVKVLQNAPREHSSILSTFLKLPFAFKTSVLSIFEWLLKTGFTVFKFW